MNPKDYKIGWLQDWIKAEEDKKHSMAVKYIEENVDLIDTDLQKFMEECPSSCHLEVYEMLLKAGIDMKDYTINRSLKQWDIYIHDANSQLNQEFTIDYKQEMDEYIDKTINWKMDYLFDCSVLDTLPAVEEA